MTNKMNKFFKLSVLILLFTGACDTCNPHAEADRKAEAALNGLHRAISK